MSTGSAAPGDAARHEVLRLLDRAGEQARIIPFWWRDDDCETVTPELDRLITLSRRFELPLALAVIPKGATNALAQRLAEEDYVRVLQHGWQHKPHNPQGERKAELGDHRPLGEIAGELRAGFDRLSNLFPGRFLPVLVPPWNRISSAVSAERRNIGLLRLSTFGRNRSGDPYWVNTHLDVFEWKPARKPLSRTAAYSILGDELENRLAGNPEPVGILTHHLVHENESWILLEELFTLLAHHPAVAWPPVAELFRLPDP